MYSQEVAVEALGPDDGTESLSGVPGLPEEAPGTISRDPQLYIIFYVIFEPLVLQDLYLTVTVVLQCGYVEWSIRLFFPGTVGIQFLLRHSIQLHQD